MQKCTNNSKLLFYDQTRLTFKEKFYLFMDLIVTNQHSSRMECAIFILIYNLQLIVGFFSIQAGILKPKELSIDNILSFIENIFRLKNFFLQSPRMIDSTIFLIICVLLILMGITLSSIYYTTKKSIHSLCGTIINFFIKCFIYVCFNIFLDLTVINFCFSSNNINPYIFGATCDTKTNVGLFLLCIVLFICSIILRIFLLVFTNDSFLLLNSCYSKISSNYDMYSTINCVLYSVFLNQSPLLTPYVFLCYNAFSSIFLGLYYYKVFLYYDNLINQIVGTFHLLHIWASWYFLIVKLFVIDNAGIVFIISSICIVWLYRRFKVKFEWDILYNKPFTKITNEYYLLFYLNKLIELIDSDELNENKKVQLTGIIEINLKEFGSFTNIQNESLYLPRTGERNTIEQTLLYDKIFLSYFIVEIMKYFLQTNSVNTDLVINLSLYYLKIIGNICQSIFFAQKAEKMKKNWFNSFTYERLKNLIERSLIEKLKTENEPCFSLEDLNTSLFFKYDHYSTQFISEIEKDLSYTFDFWKTLKQGKHSAFNYNKIFALTDKLRLTKIEVDNLFRKLYQINTGVNEIFELYLSYVEIVNDDDLLKRELENIKRKSENTTDILNVNYYNILFNKDTGLLIASGNKGQEGVIIETNRAITEIFGYGKEEIKGLNVKELMPKILRKKHQGFIEKFYETGEKKFIDKRDITSYGRDKNGNIFIMKIMLKIFPILNGNINFITMIIKEKIDNIILTDSVFNVVGMSSKLYNKFGVYLKNIFEKYEVPFFVLCKKFVNFYKTIIKTQKKNSVLLKRKNVVEQSEDSKISNQGIFFTNQINNINTFGQNQNEENKNTQQPVYPKTRRKFSSRLFKDDMHIKKSIIEENYPLVNKSNNNLKGGSIMDSSTTLNHLLQKGISGKKNKIKDNPNVLNIDSTIQEHPVMSDIIIGEQLNNLDLSENSEVEYKIQIPQFIYLFGEFIATIKNTPQDNYVDSNEYCDSSLEDIIYEENENDTQDNQDEKSQFLKTTISNNNIANIIKSSNDNDLLLNAPMHFLSKNDLQSQESEIDFIKKLSKYKQLFYQGYYDKLEEYINLNNSENINIETYTFNLIFDKYKFGDNECLFVIKCIENKNEFEINCSNESEELNPNTNVNEFALLVRKEKTQALEHLHEITEDNKQLLLNLQEEYFKLSIENLEFQRLLQKYHDDIFKLSRIHGSKKQHSIIEDENSSQSSQIGYNEDLSKKSRIEEIRTNLLKNITDFYTLRYYRFLIIALLSITIIFVIGYLVFFFLITKYYVKISHINNSFSITSNWMTFLISSLMSLRTLHILENTPLYDNYNVFLENKPIYIRTLKNKSSEWIHLISKHYSQMEGDFSFYLDNKQDFWARKDFSLLLSRNESFPLYVSQIISNAAALVRNEDFLNNTSRNNVVNDINRLEINYLAYMSITNAYIHLIPDYIVKMKSFPTFMKTFIDKNLIKFYVTLGCYLFILFVLEVLFCVTTYLTNKNIGEGFKKVSTIKEEKIDEIIKRIDNFNTMFNEYIEINYKYTNQIFEEQRRDVNFKTNNNEPDLNKNVNEIPAIDQFENNNTNISRISPELIGTNNTIIQHNFVVQNDSNTQKRAFNIKKRNSLNIKDNEINNSMVNQFLSGEKEKDKPLQLLNSSYLQPLILDLVVLSLISVCFIFTQNLHIQIIKIIDIEIYFFSRIFSSTEKLIRLKFILSKGFNDTSITSEYLNSGHFDLNTTIDRKTLINSLSEFDSISTFYSNLRIKICEIIYHDDDKKDLLLQCNNDSIIQNMNNTNSIIDNIPYKISMLLSLLKLRKDKDAEYNSFDIYGEHDFYECEKLLYNYLTPLSEEIISVTNQTVEDIIYKRKILVCLLLILLIILVFIFCIICWINFINKIAHLLTVSRAVLNIIPSVIIMNTQELENWLEKKF